MVFAKDNAKDVLCTNGMQTARPISLILEAIQDYVPEGEYEKLSQDHQVILDAGIYLSHHRVAQSILILEEVLQRPSPHAEWVKDLIEVIEIAGSMPGTGVHDLELATRRERINRDIELDHFKKMVAMFSQN